MENALSFKLTQICQSMLTELETMVENYPSGVCYLLGHCLVEGLKEAGFKATEMTGTLICKDRKEREIVYGNANKNGVVVGNYHTWCTIELDSSKIIIDPSLKYNKRYLRKAVNIKYNEKIPDILITDIPTCWLYQYIPDEKLTPFSKLFLNMAPTEIKTKLISTVSEKASTYLLN